MLCVATVVSAHWTCLKCGIRYSHISSRFFSVPGRVIASPSVARICQLPGCPGGFEVGGAPGLSKRRPGARCRGARRLFFNLIHLLIPFFLKKPGGANSQPLREPADPPGRAGWGGEMEEEHTLRLALSLCALRSAERGMYFSLRAPLSMTASPKGNEVSCVPHGAWGTEIIKAMRFSGSSRCLRWVFDLGKESEERG